MLTFNDLHSLITEAKPLLEEGKETFRLTPNQKKLITAMKNNDNLIVATGRQLGTTTAMAIYLADYILQNPHTKVVITGPYLKNSQHLLEKVRDVLKIRYKHEYMYDDEIGPFKRNNAKEIVLYNGSIITTEILGQSCEPYEYKADINVNVESAFLTQNQSSGLLDKLKRSAWQSKKDGGDGKIFLVSTFNAVPETDYFFQPAYMSTLKGETDFKAMRLTWKNDPNWDEERYKKTANCFGVLSSEHIMTELDAYPIIRPKED